MGCIYLHTYGFILLTYSLEALKGMFSEVNCRNFRDVMPLQLPVVHWTVVEVTALTALTRDR